jgi:hypothetical protein
MKRGLRDVKLGGHVGVAKGIEPTALHEPFGNVEYL